MLQNYKENTKVDVALLAEGVDRNPLHSWSRTTARSSPSSRRAWIEIMAKAKCLPPLRSPSSRRAWIEIALQTTTWHRKRVALLAEGVDRNTHKNGTLGGEDASPSSRRAWIEIDLDALYLRCFRGSPSSRRAWIEIFRALSSSTAAMVALLAEGVDRNISVSPCSIHAVRRPPRGGRG